MLTVAAALIVVTGLAHSYLGERYILMRLFRNPLPPLFGSDAFTRQTLRFVWHLTTVAWWGIAALIVWAQYGAESKSHVLFIIGVTCGISALFPLAATKGRHLSWLVFAIVAILCFTAARGT